MGSIEQPRSIACLQAEADDAGNKQPSSPHPLISKKVSDHLANERTFLAWVRTGLATITFGFVVERLPTPAPLAGGKPQGLLPSWVPFSAIVGISLTVLGLVILGLALLNFLHSRANFDRDAFHPPVRFVVLLTILASLRSPETYVGYERTEHFASPGGWILAERHLSAASTRLRMNHWALTGEWTVERGATMLNEANERIAYRFHARDLNLVMRRATRATSVRFRVFIDGQAPGKAHGSDVDEQGNGTVSDQRLYQLIRQPRHIADRLFEIKFLDAGVEAFVFTFG